MSKLSDPICPQCGTRLSPNARAGLCPRCVMEMNLATPTELPGDAGPHGTTVSKSAPPTPAQLAAKFPQLEILELIGQGGMGVVYKARQKTLDRLVALKLVSPDKERDAQFAKRFAREARTLAQLNHPNIVTVYDFGETEGLFYLLMEFVDGANLRKILGEQRLSPREAMAIVPVICDALQFAHDRGVVHCDIKPENILLDKDGRVKIADFGIARMLGRGSAEEKSPGEQAVAGTPRYMAPEQIDRPSDVDHRADIYSLGVVLYELLTGEVPKGKFEPPSKKVQIDVRLDEIVLRALEKKPELRFQTAEQFKTMVQTVGEPRSAPPQKSGPPANGLRRRLAGFAILTSAVLLTGTFFFSHTVRSPESQSAPVVRCRIFEVDAVLADKLMPVQARQSSQMPEEEFVVGSRSTPPTPAQRTETSHDTIDVLLKDHPDALGPLVDKRRGVAAVFWPRLADTAGYARNNVAGGINGFIAVRTQKGVRQLRVQYHFTHMSQTHVASELFYEGPAPRPNRACIFLVPFQRSDGTAKYIVVAFEIEPAKSATGD